MMTIDGHVIAFAGEPASSEAAGYCESVSCATEMPEVAIVESSASLFHARVRFENLAVATAGCVTTDQKTHV